MAPQIAFKKAPAPKSAPHPHTRHPTPAMPAPPSIQDRRVSAIRDFKAAIAKAANTPTVAVTVRAVFPDDSASTLAKLRVDPDIPISSIVKAVNRLLPRNTAVKPTIRTMVDGFFAAPSTDCTVREIAADNALTILVIPHGDFWSAAHKRSAVRCWAARPQSQSQSRSRSRSRSPPATQ